MSPFSPKTDEVSAIPADALPSVLNTLRGKAVFLTPREGNHGDTLIEMGTCRALSEAGVDRAGRVEMADAILICGSGGATVELWQRNFSDIRWYAQQFKEKPLIALPSSYYFERGDFARCFAGRQASTGLFAREPYSLALLQKQSFPVPVRLGLEQDMAFCLADSDFIQNLRLRSAEKHVLVVERFDAESATAEPTPPRRLYIGNPRVRSAFLRYIERTTPARLAKWRRSLAGRKQRRLSERSGFAARAVERLYSTYPEYRNLPVVAEDVALPYAFLFEEFLQLIRDAAVIISTRLHVGILGALLGKRTVLQSGDARYSKIRGVYELSLTRYPHVSLW